MPGKGSDVLAGVNIPQTDSRIPAPTGEDIAIRAKRNPVDISRVFGKGSDGLTRDSVPQADGIVLTCTC